ncbi:MAG: hypothetical protein AVO33_07320 [delta proteobacterium ML8_F1]|nr:MAG: hypothetical protein AVO33_07320 [delta proteobacterium ML8_F1]
MKYIVSSCLMGMDCKYDGGNNFNQAVADFLKDKDYILACPEQLGGLKTPRDPSEIAGEEVYTIQGVRLTPAFEKGAKEALKLVGLFGCTHGILKENSPSCGVHTVYDGTFSHKKIPGQGVTARVLQEAGLPIRSEKDFL